MRDFLHSEIGNALGVPNLPEHPELCLVVGRQLCMQLLEPLRATFGQVTVRSAYRSRALNALGNALQLSCAANERNYAGHIWDARDQNGHLGATATIVIPWFADRYAVGADWRSLPWWIHDHLPYSALTFFPKLAAFNIGWSEMPQQVIRSYIRPIGTLTRPGLCDHTVCHSHWYEGFPPLKPWCT